MDLRDFLGFVRRNPDVAPPEDVVEKKPVVDAVTAEQRTTVAALISTFGNAALDAPNRVKEITTQERYTMLGIVQAICESADNPDTVRKLAVSLAKELAALKD